MQTLHQSVQNSDSVLGIKQTEKKIIWIKKQANKQINKRRNKPETTCATVVEKGKMQRIQRGREQEKKKEKKVALTKKAIKSLKKKILGKSQRELCQLSREKVKTNER